MSIDYRPDDAPVNASILSRCTSLVPDKAGQYRTPYGASAITNWSSAFAADIVGSRMVVKADGTPFAFFGTAAKLFEWNGSTKTDVSRVANYTNGTNRWWFCQFGDTTIASNYADTTQGRSGASGSIFADIALAPKAKFFLSQSNFLLACNYDDGSAAPNGIKWASEGSVLTWIPGSGNTAGNATLRQSPGPIVAGAEIHDIVVIWKKNSMYVGKKVGGTGTNVWEFNLLSPKIGCVSQEAWVSTPVGLIFVSPYNGIYKYDGSVPTPIDRGIRNQINAGLGTLSSVQMSHDEAAGCVFIWTSSATGYCYNYISDKWSIGYGTDFANASFTTFKCAVRDANYDDFVTIGGDTQTSRRCHLIVTSEKKVCNLANASAQFDPEIIVFTVRDPRAGPHDESKLLRVTPIWGYDPEQISFVEPATGSCAVTLRSRVSGGSVAGPTLSLTSGLRFDGLAAANSFKVDLTFTDETFVLQDILYDTQFAGKR